MANLADTIIKEESKQVISGLRSHSAIVFYTSFGGGGDGFGSGSSFGSGGFGSAPRSPSSIGSGGARISDYGYGPGSPDYKMDPTGPLSAPEPIKIEPIKMDLSFQLPEATQSPFKLDLDIGKLASSILGPTVPSRFGAPRQDDYSSALFEAATSGMPKVPSSLGSGESSDLYLKKGEHSDTSYKIVDPTISKIPIVRLDLKPHEFGEKHLQYGEDLYTGRKGNDAADIFAHILVSNPHIKFPWEK